MSMEQRVHNLGIPENMPLEEQIRLLEKKLEELKKRLAENEAHYSEDDTSDMPE